MNFILCCLLSLTSFNYLDSIVEFSEILPYHRYHSISVQDVAGSDKVRKFYKDKYDYQTDSDYIPRDLFPKGPEYENIELAILVRRANRAPIWFFDLWDTQLAREHLLNRTNTRQAGTKGGHVYYSTDFLDISVLEENANIDGRKLPFFFFFYNGKVVGAMTESIIDAIIDVILGNGDSSFSYFDKAEMSEYKEYFGHRITFVFGDQPVLHQRPKAESKITYEGKFYPGEVRKFSSYVFEDGFEVYIQAYKESDEELDNPDKPKPIYSVLKGTSLEDQKKSKAAFILLQNERDSMKKIHTNDGIKVERSVINAQYIKIRKNYIRDSRPDTDPEKRQNVK
jgi:hypothetical protein